MNALLKIKNAGFEVALDGGNLVITPFSKLTEQQLGFLKAHKAEIIHEVQIASNDNPLEVTVYNRLGDPFQVIAKDEAHAAWLVTANPKPTPESVAALTLEAEQELKENVSNSAAVKICSECVFFIRDKINPAQGMGRCDLNINRKNNPLYPTQTACNQSKAILEKQND